MKRQLGFMAITLFLSSCASVGMGLFSSEYDYEKLAQQCEDCLKYINFAGPSVSAPLLHQCIEMDLKRPPENNNGGFIQPESPNDKNAMYRYGRVAHAYYQRLKPNLEMLQGDFA